MGQHKQTIEVQTTWAGQKNEGAGVALDQSLVARCGAPQPVPQAVQRSTKISQQILHCRLVGEVT